MRLEQFWHPIAKSDEIGEQPTRFRLLGQNLVAFRTDDGVSVFKDVCIHRGAALSLGWITDGRLTCPYHGWEYDRTGRCVHIPSLAPGSSIPRKASAVVYRAEERYDLVWVALEDPVEDIPGWPHDEWDRDGYRGYVALDYEWKTSAGRAVENFMDFTHFAFVHEGILGERDRTVAPQHDIVETDYGMSYSFQEEEPASLHSKEGDVVTWEYYLYRPYTIHLKKIAPDGAETLISMAVRPTDAKDARLFIWIVRNHQLDGDDQPFTDFSHTIMEQDRVIVESQQPEQIPVDLREELHLKVPDAAAIAFRRMLAQIENAAPV